MSWVARFLYAWRNADHVLVADCLALNAKLAILERERNYAWGELNRRGPDPAGQPGPALERIAVHEVDAAPAGAVELVTTLHEQLTSACRTLRAHGADGEVLLSLRPLPLDELLALLDGTFRTCSTTPVTT